jgi:hypothetical protein
LGIGDWGLGPIPNPQSPIPNPQSPIPIINFYYLKEFLLNKNIYLNILDKIKLKNGAKGNKNFKFSYKII